MITYDEHIQVFKRHLQCLGYSLNSCRKLPSAVCEFLLFCSESGLIDISKISNHHIEAYYAYLKVRPNKRRPGGLSEIVIYQDIYALRLFFNLLEQNHVIKTNPASTLVIASPHYREREILTVQEINVLFNFSQSFLEKALLSVFYGCGMRRSEVTGLDIRDVDFKNLIIYIREGKGGKRRIIPITDPISNNLKSYLSDELYCIYAKQQWKPGLLKNPYLWHPAVL